MSVQLTIGRIYIRPLQTANPDRLFIISRFFSIPYSGGCRMSATRFLVVTYIFSQTGENAFCRRNVWRASGTNRIFHFLNFFLSRQNWRAWSKTEIKEILFLHILHIFQNSARSYYMRPSIRKHSSQADIQKCEVRRRRRNGGERTQFGVIAKAICFPLSSSSDARILFQIHISKVFFPPLLLLSSSSDQASPQHIIKADTYTCVPCDRKRVQPGTLVHVPGEVGHVMKTILC